MNSGHTDVGAYSLGLLEQQDRQAFEAHLADCPACAAELAELSPMTGLLSGVGPVEPARPDEMGPADSDVSSLIHRRAMAQRRRTRWQAVLGAAAGAVLIAGGVAVGVAVTRQPAAAPPGVAGVRHSATAPGTGITGTVGLVAKGWGTQVTLDLSRIRGPLECELVAVAKTGERRVVMGWFVPAAGEGVPGHPAHLIVQGGVAFALHDLSRLSVVVVHGRTLLSIPV
jgi:hypothetical protein